jgi:hypothetical protein
MGEKKKIYKNIEEASDLNEIFDGNHSYGRLQSLIVDGYSPIDLSIKKWEYIIETNDRDGIGQFYSNCALCVNHLSRCDVCPLEKHGYRCNKENSPWYNYYKARKTDNLLSIVKYAREMLDTLKKVRVLEYGEEPVDFSQDVYKVAEELNRRMQLGEKAIDLSIEKWEYVVNNSDEGNGYQVGIRSDTCALCVSRRKITNICKDCLLPIYGFPCITGGSPFIRYINTGFKEHAESMLNVLRAIKILEDIKEEYFGEKEE